MFYTRPTGPTGPKGNGINILGSYDTYEELIKNHPTGSTDDAYIINGDLFVWSDKEKNWINTGKVQGPKGDPGPNTVRAAYLVTFNGTESKIGITIDSNGTLPIERKELDLTNLVNLNQTENTISFNVIGCYRINCIYLITPDIENIKSKSYFTNSLVTVFIEYLGKQVI